jgi:hypothetical protein
MKRTFLSITILAALIPATGFSQDSGVFEGDNQSLPLQLLAENPPLQDAFAADFDWLSPEMPSNGIDLDRFVVRGQDSGEASGGAGAGAATDPSVPLTQIQFQNVFVPESFNSSGYSNQFILQPVIPLNISENGFFPYHIIRPTLPIIAPTPDPDGPAGIEGGLGDLTLIDVYVHPIKQLKTNVGAGYIALLPTATDPQLGLGEWQFGPTVFAVTKAVPKWNLGILYEQPFSLQSNAYKSLAQIIAVRMLPDEWYVGWGDQEWTLDDQNGNYDLPLTARVGKVVDVGKHKLNIFLQPSYTPEGLHSGVGGDKWKVKLNVTFLFPKAKFCDPILSRLGGHGCCSSCCQ